MAKVIKKGTIVTTVVLGTIDVGQGVSEDYQNYQNTGYTNGRNTAVATAGVVGGIGGAIAGAELGAFIGTFIPIPAAGTVLGIVVGAGAGYLVGEISQWSVEKAYEK